MKPSFLIILFLMLHSSGIVGQDMIGEEELFLKNLNTLYQDPDQSIRVAKFLYANAENDIEQTRALYLLAESEKLKGERSNSVANLYKAKQNLKEGSSPFLLSLVLVSISERCRISGMDDISIDYLAQAELSSKKIQLEPHRAIVDTKILIERSERLQSKSNYKAALEYSQRAEAILKEKPEVSPVLNAMVGNEIGHIYLEMNRVNLARDYYNRSLDILCQSGLKNSSVEATSLFGLGRISLAGKDLQLAENYFKSALNSKIVEEEQAVSITKKLSEVYKQKDSIPAYRTYYLESSALASSISTSERSVRNIILSQIEQEQEQQLLSRQKSYVLIGGILVFVVVIGLFIYFIYNKKLDREYARFKKLLEKIENEEKLHAEEKLDASPTQSTKSLVIPESTEQAILERLEDFEKSTKFTDTNMSLNLLAKQMKTNTKYISEIIRTSKNKNFNTYINELRVNHIIHLMKTDRKYLTYKVSYLAESCGFSSHSAFTVVFKSITGLTPKQFITFLKKSKKEKSPSF